MGQRRAQNPTVGDGRAHGAYGGPCRPPFERRRRREVARGVAQQGRGAVLWREDLPRERIQRFYDGATCCLWLSCKRLWLRSRWVWDGVD